MADGFVVPDGWVAIAPLQRVVLKFLKGQWARAVASKEPANAYLGAAFLYDRVPEFVLVGVPVEAVMGPLRAAGLVEDGRRFYGGQGHLFTGITELGVLCLLFGVMPAPGRPVSEVVDEMVGMLKGVQAGVLAAVPGLEAGASAAPRSARDGRPFDLDEVGC